MTVLLSLLLMIVAVKQPATPLRDGCSADSDVLATLDAGEPVKIRYALVGESVPCYKVAIEIGGKTLEGFLPASAIAGLDEFEKGLHDAAWSDSTLMLGAIRSATRQMASLGGVNTVTTQAAGLIESSQPGKALELLENELRKKSDPNMLALAGLAAWRSDDPQRALVYWKNALEMQPNSDLERLYRRVEKETAGDQSTAKLYGLRVLLRYDANLVPVDTARLMVTALDQEFSRVSDALGCTASERLVAIVQSREAYHKSTDAAEWNGGQFDGRIRVPVAGGQGMDAPLLRIFAHESTHACLSMMGRWPAWFQEGLAQKLSGDVLSPLLRAKLEKMAKDGRLPRLENLHQDWSRLDTEHALAAYALSLAAIEMFYQSYAAYGIRNLMSNPQKLAEVTADLDKRLGLSPP
jgi:tetratricopeptide (TPR) repeat protein